MSAPTPPAVSSALPIAYLVRHGATAWSVSGQHTGRTDLALTEQGERDAVRLGERLRALTPTRVLTSPLQRAVRTCELGGFGGAEVDPDLIEWDYGDYEGLTSAEIRMRRPGWSLFRDGCPGGETLAEIGMRADRVAQRLRAAGGDTLLFSSAHFLRVLAARWLGLDAAGGRYLTLGTTALSALGYEHDLTEPVIRLWNET